MNSKRGTVGFIDGVEWTQQRYFWSVYTLFNI